MTTSQQLDPADRLCCAHCYAEPRRECNDDHASACDDCHQLAQAGR